MNYKIHLATLIMATLAACRTMPPSPVYGPTNPAPAVTGRASVKYCASVVELRPEKEKKYRELHARVWPQVVAAIQKAHIRNYNIYVAPIGGRRYLFSQFEYTGSDLRGDLASIANDPTTKNKWWPLTDACQIRLSGTPKGQQWLPAEQVMHVD